MSSPFFVDALQSNSALSESRFPVARDSTPIGPSRTAQLLGSPSILGSGARTPLSAAALVGAREPGAQVSETIRSAVLVGAREPVAQVSETFLSGVEGKLEPGITFVSTTNSKVKQSAPKPGFQPYQRPILVSANNPGFGNIKATVPRSRQTAPSSDTPHKPVQASFAFKKTQQTRAEQIRVHNALVAAQSAKNSPTSDVKPASSQGRRRGKGKGRGGSTGSYESRGTATSHHSAGLSHSVKK